MTGRSHVVQDPILFTGSLRPDRSFRKSEVETCPSTEPYVSMHTFQKAQKNV